MIKLYEFSKFTRSNDIPFFLMLLGDFYLGGVWQLNVCNLTNTIVQTKKILLIDSFNINKK